MADHPRLLPHRPIPPAHRNRDKKSLSGQTAAKGIDAHTPGSEQKRAQHVPLSEVIGSKTAFTVSSG
jgi:hypothetical protein